MKTLKLIALTACALLFSQCKTTAPTAPSGPAPSLLEVHYILDSAQSHFLLFADQTNGDPAKAIELTTNWLNLQPTVQSAESLDSAYVTITLKSGLTTTFSFEQVDSLGHDVFRGGGGTNLNIPALVSSQQATKTITNKKVLIYAPTFTEFDLDLTVPNTVSRFNNSGLGIQTTVLRDDKCTYEAVSTFPNYGLVIIDTHGQPDAFLVGSTLSMPTPPTNEDAVKAAVTSTVGPNSYNELISGNLTLGAEVKANPNIPGWQKTIVPTHDRSIWYSSEFLKALPDMSNTIVFGNMCYSGQRTKLDVRGRLRSGMKTPIATAFINKNLISYYGYALEGGSSLQVSDPFAKQMEDSLVRRLVENVDSTKIVHLKSDNVTEYNDPFWIQKTFQFKLYLKHLNSDNYSYANCVDSFTDARDGHIYHAVCIGNQNWMAENLDYKAAGSTTYNNDPANEAIYGRLYDWNTLMQGAPTTDAIPSGVQGVCPKGWHVPSVPEFDQLFNFLGGNDVAGGAMKSLMLWASPNVSATNSSGFSAIPGGYYDGSFPANNFRFIGGQGAFCTTSTLGTENHSYFYLSSDGAGVSKIQAPKIAASCRCLKD